MSSDRGVVIYTKKIACPYCTKAKSLLHNRNIDFKEIDISNNYDLISELSNKTGRKSVPQIFINQKFIGGYDELHKMDQNGELDQNLISR